MKKIEGPRWDNGPSTSDEPLLKNRAQACTGDRRTYIYTYIFNRYERPCERRSMRPPRATGLSQQPSASAFLMASITGTASSLVTWRGGVRGGVEGEFGFRVRCLDATPGFDKEAMGMARNREQAPSDGWSVVSSCIRAQNARATLQKRARVHTRRTVHNRSGAAHHVFRVGPAGILRVARDDVEVGVEDDLASLRAHI